VYIDSEDADMDFIRKEISFVNYVVDRKEADVHILITDQDTGSGGEEFTLTFLGQSRYRFRNDTLTYATGPDDTEDAVRNKMTRYLKLGLASYAAKSPIGMDLSVSYSGSGNEVVKRDRWNNWLIRAEIDGHFDGEKYVKSTDMDGSLSANRITEVWKIRLVLGGSLNENRFRETDSTGAVISTINSTSRSKNLSGLVVRGFSFTTHGGLSLIHDQLALPKGEVEIEDLLLRRRQLQTQYSYWLMIGFEYAFGSIYNNIVNPRFGG
jgi:hypothetical protein